LHTQDREKKTATPPASPISHVRRQGDAHEPLDSTPLRSVPKDS
jgi:hypothetical protein